MTLQVGTTPHSQWRVLTPLLKKLGWEDAHDPESWYQNAEVSPDGIRILLHSRPEIAVAHAIEAGQQPRDAVEAWRNAAEQMLAFYKRNRATTAMVEVSSAVRDPRAFARALEHHLDLKMKGSLPKLTPPEQQTSANQVQASELIAANDELSSLLAELEACTLPLEHGTFRSPGVQILELYKQLHEATPDLTVEQLEESTRLLETLAQLEDGFENERDEHLRTKSALEEVREENDLVMRQLFDVQEELEHYYLAVKQKDKALEASRTAINQKNTKLKRMTAEMRQLRAQVSALEAGLAKLHRSVSWRLTAPIRLLAKPFGRSARARSRKETKLIIQSEFFDAAWYLATYPDVAKSKIPPATHYVRYGANEHRDPSIKFSTKQYLRAYQDVAQSGVNPLVHYLMFGQAEGRSPMPASNK